MIIPDLGVVYMKILTALPQVLQDGFVLQQGGLEMLDDLLYQGGDEEVSPQVGATGPVTPPVPGASESVKDAGV